MSVIQTKSIIHHVDMHLAQQQSCSMSGNQLLVNFFINLMFYRAIPHQLSEKKNTVSLQVRLIHHVDMHLAQQQSCSMSGNQLLVNFFINLMFYRAIPHQLSEKKYSNLASQTLRVSLELELESRDCRNRASLI